MYALLGSRNVYQTLLFLITFAVLYFFSWAYPTLKKVHRRYRAKFYVLIYALFCY